MTLNEEKILKIMREKIEWRPPTMRRMVEITGMSDITSVVWVLKSLEKKGYLKKIGRNYQLKEMTRLNNIDSTSHHHIVDGECAHCGESLIEIMGARCERPILNI